MQTQRQFSGFSGANRSPKGLQGKQENIWRLMGRSTYRPDALTPKTVPKYEAVVNRTIQLFTTKGFIGLEIISSDTMT